MIYSSKVKGQDTSQLFKRYTDAQLENFQNKAGMVKQSFKKTLPADSSVKGLKIAKPTFEFPKFSKPFLVVNGGRIDYTFYYRSNIDTPLIQQNVYQHQLSSTINLTIGNLLPVKVNTQMRRSNSLLFRDINDIQIEFDMQQFQQKIYSNVLSGISQKAALLKDEITGQLGEVKSLEYLKLKDQFNSKFSLQGFVEAKELLNVPQLSWDNSLPDSLARIKSDSLKEEASKYIRLYTEANERIEKIKYLADSLKTVYNKSLLKVRQIQDLTKGKINNPDQYKKLINDTLIKNSGIDLLPSKYRWLLGIRKFSLGRSPINYSELTAKNISLNGINFEYNSWYYASFSAGLIDYRFRDFVIQRPNKPKQYFYMGRIGLGDINRNYCIVSLFKGQKQVFASGGINNLYTVNTTGISVEAKYQINKYSFIKAEIAESVAPDFRTSPPKNNGWNLTEKTDKAYAVSAHFVIPATQTKVDAAYRYTGAHFQSFSSFQTNATQNNWNIKAEQNFFRKQLRITATVKSNEFSNPYLIQAYQSNTVFKSVQAVFRKRNWPVISAGFMPMTQLTNIGGLIVENRFNSLNVTTYHHYRISDIKAATTLVYTKFYNSNADSGFIYFNASNIFINHLLYFRSFKAAVNITHSTNKNYELNVMDENIQVPVNKIGAVLFGVKINNLNKLYNKVGIYGNIQLSFLKNSIISFLYEDGYIPGIQGTLVKNRIGSIQLSKSF